MSRSYGSVGVVATNPDLEKAMQRIAERLTELRDSLTDEHGVSVQLEHVAHAVTTARRSVPSSSPQGTQGIAQVLPTQQLIYHATALIHFSYDSIAAQADARHQTGHYALAEVLPDTATLQTPSGTADPIKEAE